MPPLEGVVGYLVGHLFDIGPFVNTGMGRIAIRSEHILPWQEETGITLRPWESRFIRQLSSAYISESARAEKMGCQPPWKPDGAKPEPSAAQQSLRSLAKS